MKKAKIILVIGGCCTGKATLARMLAERVPNIQYFVDLVSIESYKTLLANGQSAVIPATLGRARELLAEFNQETLIIFLDATDATLEQRTCTARQLSLEEARKNLKDIRNLRDWGLSIERARPQRTAYIDTHVNNPEQVFTISQEFLEAA